MADFVRYDPFLASQVSQLEAELLNDGRPKRTPVGWDKFVRLIDNDILHAVQFSRIKRLRFGRWFLQQKREQIADFLGGQLVQKPLRHDRLGTWFLRFDLARMNANDLPL